MRGIQVRAELTNEWKNREVGKQSARKDLESKTGKNIVTNKNYLHNNTNTIFDDIEK